MTEVWLLWDTSPIMKGRNAELIGVFDSVDDALNLARNEFDTDSYDFAQVEHWIAGDTEAQASFTLAENIAGS